MHHIHMFLFREINENKARSLTSGVYFQMPQHRIGLHLAQLITLILSCQPRHLQRDLNIVLITKCSMFFNCFNHELFLLMIV